MSKEFRLHQSDKHEGVYREDSLLLTQTMSDRVDFNSLFDTGSKTLSEPAPGPRRLDSQPATEPEIEFLPRKPGKRRRVKQIKQGEGTLSLIRSRIQASQ